VNEVSAPVLDDQDVLGTAGGTFSAWNIWRDCTFLEVQLPMPGRSRALLRRRVDRRMSVILLLIVVAAVFAFLHFENEDSSTNHVIVTGSSQHQHTQSQRARTLDDETQAQVHPGLRLQEESALLGTQEIDVSEIQNFTSRLAMPMEAREMHPQESSMCSNAIQPCDGYPPKLHIGTCSIRTSGRSIISPTILEHDAISSTTINEVKIGRNKATPIVCMVLKIRLPACIQYRVSEDAPSAEDVRTGDTTTEYTMGQAPVQLILRPGMKTRVGVGMRCAQTNGLVLSQYNFTFMVPHSAATDEGLEPKPESCLQQGLIGEKSLPPLALTLLMQQPVMPHDHVIEEFRPPNLVHRERIEAIRLTLNVLASILEAYDITYWLNGGTLLGALRHCDVIPWDTDGDVMVPYRKGYVDLNEAVGYIHYGSDTFLLETASTAGVHICRTYYAEACAAPYNGKTWYELANGTKANDGRGFLGARIIHIQTGVLVDVFVPSVHNSSSNGIVWLNEMGTQQTWFPMVNFNHITPLHRVFLFDRWYWAPGDSKRYLTDQKNLNKAPTIDQKSRSIGTLAVDSDHAKYVSRQTSLVDHVT